MGEIVACICEGSAEKAIMEILFDAGRLKFSLDDVIDKTQPILGSYYRKAKNFERDYLTKFFGGDSIVIYYIHDKKVENYRLNPKYNSFVKCRSCLTRPEIEMLYIISVGKYDNYKKKHHVLKPSDYVKEILNCKRIKEYKFIKKHFSDAKLLIDTLKKYKKTHKKEFTIYDLVKQ